MSSIRSRIAAGVLCVSGLYATSASAAEVGFYVGGLYGDASRDVEVGPFAAYADDFYADLADATPVDDIPTNRTYTTDRSSRAFGFFAGYRLTQHFAVEGGYVTLGKDHYRESSIATSDGEAFGLFTGFTNTTSGFSISALGVLPISYAWELYGRAGVLIGSNKLSIYVTDGEGTIRLEDTDSSTDLLAGAGIAWSLAEVYTLRAEYQRVFDAGSSAFGQGDIDLASIGITVAF